MASLQGEDNEEVLVSTCHPYTNFKSRLHVIDMESNEDQLRCENLLWHVEVARTCDDYGGKG